LSDLLLASGFGNPYGVMKRRTMRRCTTRSSTHCSSGALLKRRSSSCWAIRRMAIRKTRSKLEELIQQIIERMGEQGYITMPPDLEAERQRRNAAAAGRA
jgi:hypothetical protein